MLNKEKTIEDVNDYFQELKDYGFDIKYEVWRGTNKISRIEFILKSNKEILYNEIKEILEEALDRISEFYDYHEIAIKSYGDPSPSNTGKIYYSKLPNIIFGNVETIWINVAEKKKPEKFAGIKRFLNF